MPFKKGQNPWNKGKKLPQYSGSNHPMFGRSHTEEAKKKIGIATKKRLKDETKHPLWGKKHSEETKRKMSLSQKFKVGELAGNWKGGKKNYWTNYVRQRDGKCMKCGIDDKRVLTADHIKSKKMYPELKYDLNNGITLCFNCHAIKTLYEDREYKTWWLVKIKEGINNKKMMKSHT